jgi:hypothetical protein
MSSDESDDDGSGELESFRLGFHVKKMPWRRDVTKELQLLDDERMQSKAVFRRKGSKPAPRIRLPDGPRSTREAPKRLPRSFYNDDWFSSLDSREKRRLAVPSVKFPWLNLVTDLA